MGASGIEVERAKLIKINNRKHFFSAYSSIKDFIIGSIDMINKEVYLIESNSISNFLKLLNEYKVFENLNKNEELNKIEEKLKTKFEDYSIQDNNVIIYSNYQACKEASKNESNNIFIIVDENFIVKYEVKNAKYKEVKIIEKYDKHLKIIFPISQKTINAEEIENKKGFFKFCPEEENENNNRNEINIIETNENKEEIRFNSMIKNICYCLIKIKTLNYYFLCCGDIIKENKYISKIFFDIIEQRNISGKIDCFELSKIFKSQKLSEIKTIIDYLYINMHDELKENNLSNNNIFINNRSLNQTGEDSIIKKIFYFYNTIYYKCSVCNNNSSNISFMNIISFPLNIISKYKKSKKLLNISDCFDYFISTQNIECPNCTNRSNSYYYSKIKSINEILTIVIDRENNLINDISFQLDFKLELSKYCLNNEKCELELIGFSCYDNNKDIYYSYFKMNPENKWYYFNDTKEKIINIEEQNYEFPVLLFYKKVDNNV